MSVSYRIQVKNTRFRDFPGGPVVKNPPYNAGDAGLIPGPGNKFPQAAWQLSLCAKTAELGASTREPTGPGIRTPQLQSPLALEPVCHS